MNIKNLMADASAALSTYSQVQIRHASAIRTQDDKKELLEYAASLESMAAALRSLEPLLSPVQTGIDLGNLGIVFSLTCQSKIAEDWAEVERVEFTPTNRSEAH